MNNTSDGAELVAQWRNHGEQDNPAGPLFAAGEFAEADIVNATAEFGPVALLAPARSRDIQCC
jgi:hypothetical protein